MVSAQQAGEPGPSAVPAASTFTLEEIEKILGKDAAAKLEQESPAKVKSEAATDTDATKQQVNDQPTKTPPRHTQKTVFFT